MCTGFPSGCLGSGKDFLKPWSQRAANKNLATMNEHKEETTHNHEAEGGVGARG